MSLQQAFFSIDSFISEIVTMNQKLFTMVNSGNSKAVGIVNQLQKMLGCLTSVVRLIALMIEEVSIIQKAPEASNNQNNEVNE